MAKPRQWSQDPLAMRALGGAWVLRPLLFLAPQRAAEWVLSTNMSRLLPSLLRAFVSPTPHVSPQPGESSILLIPEARPGERQHPEVVPPACHQRQPSPGAEGEQVSLQPGKPHQRPHWLSGSRRPWGPVLLDVLSAPAIPSGAHRAPQGCLVLIDVPKVDACCSIPRDPLPPCLRPTLL